jgi:hypothetical protein
MGPASIAARETECALGVNDGVMLTAAERSNVLSVASSARNTNPMRIILVNLAVDFSVVALGGLDYLGSAGALASWHC